MSESERFKDEKSDDFTPKPTNPESTESNSTESRIENSRFQLEQQIFSRNATYIQSSSNNSPSYLNVNEIFFNTTTNYCNSLLIITIKSSLMIYKLTFNQMKRRHMIIHSGVDNHIHMTHTTISDQADLGHILRRICHNDANGNILNTAESGTKRYNNLTSYKRHNRKQLRNQPRRINTIIFVNLISNCRRITY